MYDEIDQGMVELAKRVIELTKNEDIRRNARLRPRGACGTLRDDVRRNTRQRNSVTPCRYSEFQANTVGKVKPKYCVNRMSVLCSCICRASKNSAPIPISSTEKQTGKRGDGTHRSRRRISESREDRVKTGKQVSSNIQEGSPSDKLRLITSSMLIGLRRESHDLMELSMADGPRRDGQGVLLVTINPVCITHFSTSS